MTWRCKFWRLAIVAAGVRPLSAKQRAALRLAFPHADASGSATVWDKSGRWEPLAGPIWWLKAPGESYRAERRRTA
jgi:hypothetical protein